jgi:hypothetical protein
MMLPRAVRRRQAWERPSGARFDKAPGLDRRHKAGRFASDL